MAACGSVVLKWRSGRAIDEVSGMRRWVADDYVVRYFTDGQILTVSRIWHGKEYRLK